MQQSALCDMGDHGRFGLGVEVARQDDGTPRGEAGDALQQQRNTLAAGRLAHVVQVGVDEEEFAAVAVTEHCPGRQPVAGAVPPLRARLFGSLAQPEGSPVEQLETVRTVENRVEFAGFGSVVASHTHLGVTGKQPLQVVELVDQQLLRPEDVDGLRFDDPGDPVAAELPVVRTVVRIVVAHVERHHVQFRLRLRTARRQKKQRYR